MAAPSSLLRPLAGKGCRALPFGRARRWNRDDRVPTLKLFGQRRKLVKRAQRLMPEDFEPVLVRIVVE